MFSSRFPRLKTKLGESPSGKALVFGTSIRRFESSLPSLQKLTAKSVEENGRIEFSSAFSAVNS